MLKRDLAIITPYFEDGKSLSCLLEDIYLKFGSDVFVVVVDDGSVSEPASIDMLANAGVSGAVIRLLRNVGHQRAIAVGMGLMHELVEPCRAIIIMDSDGEDRPASINELIKALESDDVDVAVATRRSRVESFKFKSFYAIYKMLFRILCGRTINFGNFMAIEPKAIHRLVAMQELPIHLAATVLLSRLRTVLVPIDRGSRYEGHSKMNFVGLTLHGFKALMVFAEDVLVRVGISSAFVAGSAVFAGLIAIVLKLLDYATPGWFSVALGILTLIFMQTGALSLMMLMLTGVTRAGSVTPRHFFREYVAEIECTEPLSASAESQE